MKNIMRSIVVTLALSGLVFASTIPALATTASTVNLASSSSNPTQNPDQVQLPTGDGAPMPACSPGHPCGNDNLQLRAGDGAPDAGVLARPSLRQ